MEDLARMGLRGVEWLASDLSLLRHDLTKWDIERLSILTWDEIGDRAQPYLLVPQWKIPDENVKSGRALVIEEICSKSKNGLPKSKPSKCRSDSSRCLVRRVFRGSLFLTV